LDACAFACESVCAAAGSARSARTHPHGGL
jgi:hypothetical protein